MKEYDLSPEKWTGVRPLIARRELGWEITEAGLRRAAHMGMFEVKGQV
jgi:hypothetical protein